MSAEPPLDAQALAEAVGQAMWAQDAATRGLGMQLLHIGPGQATIGMTVTEEMLNGHRTCHGGFISALADSAFAFACNAGNEATVASGFSIDFLAPGRCGDQLQAQAQQISRAGRTGVYDVQVRNQHGELIAIFRGRSHALKGRAVLS